MRQNHKVGDTVLIEGEIFYISELHRELGKPTKVLLQSPEERLTLKDFEKNKITLLQMRSFLFGPEVENTDGFDIWLWDPDEEEVKRFGGDDLDLEYCVRTYPSSIYFYMKAEEL